MRLLNNSGRFWKESLISALDGLSTPEVMLRKNACAIISDLALFNVLNDLWSAIDLAMHRLFDQQLTINH